MSISTTFSHSPQVQTAMLEGFGFLFQILGLFGLTWAVLVLYILIKNGHLKNNVAYIPAAGLALANVGQLILLVGHLAPALYSFSIHGSPEDPCDGVFIILWYGSLGNVLVMAISRCWVTWHPTNAKRVFTLRRMILFCVSGFVLGACVAALPYLNVCCHFAFQISSTVIDNKAPNAALPLLQQAANASIETLLSVNFSVVVPNTANEYLTIIKTNNVLLLTHVIDFCTVFISVVCYALVFLKVRRHGNKISAQQHHNQGGPGQQSKNGSPDDGSRRRPFARRTKQEDVEAGLSNAIETIPDHQPPTHLVATRQQPRVQQRNPLPTSRITSTSDVRMLRRISTHFCLMSSAVMFFSVILLIVHRYPTEPALVLLHQLFYVLTATVNSFLISTLNEKIRTDFRKCLARIKAICCGPASFFCRCCKCGCCIRCRENVHGHNGEETTKRTTNAVGITGANTRGASHVSGSGVGHVVTTFDLTHRIHH